MQFSGQCIDIVATLLASDVFLHKILAIYLNGWPKIPYFQDPSFHSTLFGMHIIDPVVQFVHDILGFFFIYAL